MVDTAGGPPLKLTSRRTRSAALSEANAGAATDATRRKPKTVASRYLAPFSSSRSATSSTTASTAAAPRRSASPATRRALPPNAVAAAGSPASSGTATATTRTLSVAFQSPTYCLDTSKVGSVSPAAAAPFSPEKGRFSSTAATSVRDMLSHGSQNAYRLPASGHDAAALATPKLEYSASNCNRTAASALAAGRASVDGANEYLRALYSEDTETDSASSGGSSRDGADKPPVVAPGPRASPRSVFTSSSARFARDAVGTTRSDRFAYPARTVPSRAPAAAASPSPVKKNKSLFNGLLSSPFNRLSLKQQQQSPSKPVCSSFRMTESPSRARRSMGLPGLAGKLQGKACSSDGDKKKVKTPGPTKAEDEHQLRLSYTRHLQWRHANAKAAAALSSQRAAQQKILYGVCIDILRVRKSVAIAKLQLQLLRNNYKLMAILRGQMIYLEEWSSLERVYANSLSGTAQALNATIVRLPVSDGAMADIQALKNAVGSAVDVMQSIAFSTSTQLSKLARANVLVSQLSRVVVQELVLMAQCRELLSTLASMHVKHCSLQGQRVQLNQRRNRRFQYCSGYLLHFPTEQCSSGW